MTRFILFLAISIGMLVPPAKAQQLTPPQQRAVDQHFKKNKVVYFKFNVRSLQEIPHFAKIISVDKTQGVQVMAHADKKQFSQFIRFNIPYTVTPRPVSKQTKKKEPAKK